MTVWSMKQALFCLIGSTCVTLTLSLTSYSFYKKSVHKKLYDEKYQIRAIVQTGLEKEALKTAYLAEILGLSTDKPPQLYSIDLKLAEKTLLNSPLIAKAKVKRLPPATLYIDYEVRKPVALLADFKNTAVDREGALFPVEPFFSPKNLPELYLGVPEFTGWQVEDQNFQLALNVIEFLESAPWKEGLRIKRIDVSKASAPSLGQREIVLFTEEELFLQNDSGEIICTFPKILRLAPKDYRQQLNNFFALRRTMMDDYRRQLATLKKGGEFAPRIIDLRIPQLAFVEKG